ncbi:hypothetical protein TRICI_000475 [Trichomonascus ciferrii]|uniref:RING-type domain-containing protein n=1 Tax=Trichomonascus ciferrii TaxID=44093 RepID=A0A642VDA2_9ASCO|nr:hypothetical protein TRICI_000475 [Trichomonascus ciferrii]
MSVYQIKIALDWWEKSDDFINRVIGRNDIFIKCEDDGDCEYSVQKPADTADKAQIDWRYSGIRLITHDMEQMDGTSSATAGDFGPLKSKYLGSGVIKLYRDADDSGETWANEQISNDENRSGTVMAILAVPSYFTPSDILGFVGSKFSDDVSHFRMVRTSVDNRYMVLIKFRNTGKASEFYDEYNGRLFNSMEAESCHVVYVKSIEFNSHVRASDDEIPYLLEDDFTASPPAHSVATTAATSSKPNPPLPRSLRELPTCPVCLERMDTSVTGLLTILCQHTFHCQCLSKWGDGSCPVCRYSQRGNYGKPANNADELKCQICQANVNLWMCVVCGQVGCGRYDQAHAYDHYVNTGHCYSMDIATQRVWDYANDGYVHRLIQNQSDGKLVELPQPGASSNGNSGSEVTDQKKLDDIGLQYTALLTSQLESQRMYYEDMFASFADRAQEASEKAERAEKELEELKKEMNELRHEREYEVPKLKQDLASATDKANKLRELYNHLQRSYKDEKTMSQKMVDKLESLTRAKTEQDLKVQELEEQLRDIMFFMDAKDKLANTSEDVQQGQIVVPSPSKGKNKKRR